MEKIRSISKFIAIALVPMVFALYYNARVNQHYHIKNGKLISHSHPYKSSSKQEPIQKHKHGDGLCQLLMLTGENFTDGSSVIDYLELSVPETLHDFNFYKYSEHHSQIPLNYVLRGPPSIS